MQNVREILGILNALSPFETQEGWDNCGLNVGSFELEPKRVYVALEATLEGVESMEDDSLLIVHHPLIFKPLRNMTDNTYPTNIIKKMMRKNAALIALHTNFDKSHLSRLLVADILGFRCTHHEGYIAFFELCLSHQDLVQRIKSALGISHLVCTNPKTYYHTGALISGAGASMAESLEVDCLLSGDLRYHDAMIARSLGKSVFDIRHYESESFFAPFMQKLLSEKQIQAIALETPNPFIFC